MSIITPLLAVDGFIKCFDDEGHFKGIILIERLNEPYGWALPGGFVDLNETVEEALIREIKEEAKVDINFIKLAEVRSKPNRDPRGSVVSIVFKATTTDYPIAADDAKSVKLIKTKDELDELNIVFDHKEIINNNWS